ncbi:MAG: hypothetical protein GY845_24465 [Planctomycetes bacterium]|nr:hypothetical protein [Planctomycetota bacterium]
MSEQTKDAISIVPLLLGSILLIAVGFGFISSNNVLLVGIFCFIVSALIGRIFKKTT